MYMPELVVISMFVLKKLFSNKATKCIYPHMPRRNAKSIHHLLPKKKREKKSPLTAYEEHNHLN